MWFLLSEFSRDCLDGHLMREELPWLLCGSVAVSCFTPLGADSEFFYARQAPPRSYTLSFLLTYFLSSEAVSLGCSGYLRAYFVAQAGFHPMTLF